jgi:hypothetical protein
MPREIEHGKKRRLEHLGLRGFKEEKGVIFFFGWKGF